MMRINHVYLKLIVTVKHENNGIDWVTYYLSISFSILTIIKSIILHNLQY